MFQGYLGVFLDCISMSSCPTDDHDFSFCSFDCMICFVFCDTDLLYSVPGRFGSTGQVSFPPAWFVCMGGWAVELCEHSLPIINGDIYLSTCICRGKS